MKTLRSRVYTLESEVAVLRNELRAIRSMDSLYVSIPTTDNIANWVPVNLREVIDKLIKDAGLKYELGGLK